MLLIRYITFEISYSKYHFPSQNFLICQSNGNPQPQQRQSNADEDFDIDALMPSIPTGFKGNNNDNDDQPGNAGGGGDFDDLEARFANLKK